MRNWLSDLIALCRYDNVVPLFRSTRPDVQYVMESLAILIPCELPLA